MGAYFSDEHPDLVDEVIAESDAIERAGLRAYADAERHDRRGLLRDPADGAGRALLQRGGRLAAQPDAWRSSHASQIRLRPSAPSTSRPVIAPILLSRLPSVLRCTGRAAAVAARSKSCSISSVEGPRQLGVVVGEPAVHARPHARGEPRRAAQQQLAQVVVDLDRAGPTLADGGGDHDAQLVERLRQLGERCRVALARSRRGRRRRAAAMARRRARARRRVGPPTRRARARRAAARRSQRAAGRCAPARPARTDGRRRPARSRSAPRAGGPRRSAARRRRARQQALGAALLLGGDARRPELR